MVRVFFWELNRKKERICWYNLFLVTFTQVNSFSWIYSAGPSIKFSIVRQYIFHYFLKYFLMFYIDLYGIHRSYPGWGIHASSMVISFSEKNIRLIMLGWTSMAHGHPWVQHRHMDINVRIVNKLIILHGYCIDASTRLFTARLIFFRICSPCAFVNRK